ncbi:ABC transporter [Nocardiopsis sp. TSRI0078]|uniref:ABC transporter permease n=1 Tax=unclassified Nocardiopsis TaxID=2649073 RepID=UPI0009400D69|nr:ABC transporter permease [Nocardiopsis sp. TSRI0078]OKI14635.1 ABC transporter [Nocardiopsis sp. TSRI0078]
MSIRAEGPSPADRPPGALRVGLSRGLLEIREFAHAWKSVILTFSLPALVLAMLSSLLDGVFAGTSAVDHYLPGLIAMGLMSVSFQNLGLSIAQERDTGGLRRLRGTPMPPTAYFVGKTVLVMFLALGQVALLLGVARLAFGARLPADPAAWATLGWVLLLGTASCSLLGIAVSSLVRDSRSASGIVIAPFLVLRFTSGIFVPVAVLPGWVVDAASLFPLLWMAQGLRAAFLPAGAAALEPGGAWNPPSVALALGVWCVVGLALVLLTFRWKAGKDG